MHSFRAPEKERFRSKFSNWFAISGITICSCMRRMRYSFSELATPI